MKGQSEEFGVAVVIGVLALGLVLGAINGALVVVTRVPDIVVTLAMSFVWAGCALLVLQHAGRRRGALAQGARQRARSATSGSRKAAVVLVVVVARHLDPAPALDARACRIYAIGSNRLAAFRSGVSVGRTKILAYALARAVRRARRPRADREHRHRHAGPRARTRC